VRPESRLGHLYGRFLNPVGTLERTAAQECKCHQNRHCRTMVHAAPTRIYPYTNDHPDPFDHAHPHTNNHQHVDTYEYLHAICNITLFPNEDLGDTSHDHFQSSRNVSRPECYFCCLHHDHSAGNGYCGSDCDSTADTPTTHGDRTRAYASSSDCSTH
jgi:hypothetical protein